MKAFIETSREELPIGDGVARGCSALRLADCQASASSPRFAIHDGGDVRSLAIWDLYFIEEACRRLPRSAGLVHFHTGWAGLATVRLGQSARQLQFRCRDAFDQQQPKATEPSANEVQAAIVAYAAALDPRWTIVLTRILNEVPDPNALLESVLATRQDGGAVIATAMGSPLTPFLFSADARLGLPDWGMVRCWANRTPPILSAIESATITEAWPQHILFGVAFAP